MIHLIYLYVKFVVDRSFPIDFYSILSHYSYSIPPVHPQLNSSLYGLEEICIHGGRETRRKSFRGSREGQRNDDESRLVSWRGSFILRKAAKSIRSIADFIRRSETDYRGKKEEEEEEEGKKEIAAISPWGIHLDARKKKEKGEKSETTGYRLPRDFN